MSVIPTHEGKRAYKTLDQAGNGPWDVIIIGSGMAGMSCAAALSRYGRKVLLLEQHYIPGGFTHMFARKGFAWDAGIHALGEMTPKDMPFKMLKWLSGGKVQMEALGNPFDRFRFPDGYQWDLPDTEKAYKTALYEGFPEQKQALDKYFLKVKRAARRGLTFFAFKSFSKWLDQGGNAFLNGFGRDWRKVTTSEVLDQCGVKGKLRTILTVHWGYYGSIPQESSFMIHALTHTHFWNGAYYPVGGSKSVASALLGVVLEKGGEILTRAEVDEILLEGNKAVGVKMKNGMEFRAKKIVSAAGAKNTVNYLLPEKWQGSEWAREISGLRNSPPYICMNLGFEGDIKAAGAKSSNLWLFDTWGCDQTHWDMHNPRPHILYCSFPSLKDPEHDPGPKQKHTGEAITFLPYDAFEKWKDSQHREREVDYLDFKAEIEDRLLKTMQQNMPELMSLVVHHELSTPLTAEHFARADQGAIYGLEASPQRFTNNALRTRTPIKNFLLSGIDVAAIGVISAMTSGMLTAATLEPRVYRHLIF